MLPNIDYDSAATTAWDADIKSLTTFKDTVVPALVKDLLESVIAVLTLVRVSFPIRSSLLHLLISGTTRAR